MNFPKFSVVIALYNKEPYIKRAILSVLNQTYQNFELIIVNDGSTDNSEEIARSIDSNKITLIVKTNGGESSARNAGIKVSSGDFICFLDGDDEYLENHLEVLNNLILKFPDYSFFATNSYDLFEKNGKLTAAFPVLEEFLVVENYSESCRHRSFVSSNTACIKRLAFDFNNLFDENLRFGPDLEMWFRLSLDCDLIFCSIPTAIYHREAEQRVMSNLVHFNEKFIEKLFYNIQPQLKNESLKKYVEAKLIQEIKRHLRLNKNNEVRRNIIRYRKYFTTKSIFFQWLFFSYLPFKTLSDFRLKLKRV